LLVQATRGRHDARLEYPRVVKVKMSNFELKKPQNVGGHRDFDDEMRILGAA